MSSLTITSISSELSRSELREMVAARDAVIGSLTLENRSLQSRINMLEHDKIVLESIIETNNQTIGRLTEENKKLKKRIKTLENEVKDLKNEVKELKTELTQTNSRFFISKLVSAIQEVNRRDKLEESEGLDYLEDLRNDRNQISHFMFVNNRNRKYETSIIQYGKKLLYTKLEQAKNEKSIMSVLEIYSPTLVDDMMKHLSPSLNVNISDLPQTEKAKLDAWWSV